MVDWTKAPEGAEYYNNYNNKFYRACNHRTQLFDINEWRGSDFSAKDLMDRSTFTPRPAPEWPSDNRIDVIGQNGNTGSHYTAPVNKYDRVIHGKYGGGAVTVDVYRVLNAFGPLSPEVQHAVKKLLAAGSRGHKDEKQDLLEAIQSIEARLKYLEDCDGN